MVEEKVQSQGLETSPRLGVTCSSDDSLVNRLASPSFKSFIKTLHNTAQGRALRHSTQVPAPRAPSSGNPGPYATWGQDQKTALFCGQKPSKEQGGLFDPQKAFCSP